MIFYENQAANNCTTDADFTVGHYQELLRIAVANWRTAQYDAIPWGSRFVLWRHDIDFSLNRSLALARLEHKHGVKATFFVNPHSEFYNLAERCQFQIVQQILSLGHKLGLHFDGAFHNITSEADMNQLVAREASYLEKLFGVRPVALSFHNPVAAHLACEADHYGGLVNCYSRRFKAEVRYCSDSNGYWRFRRLYDVLTEASDPCLQVLTHPGWWQDKSMAPRQRVSRSVFGRARSTMRFYDASVLDYGRLNHAGPSQSLKALAKALPRSFELCDFLWSEGHFSTLFVELWRLHEAQVARLCMMQLCREWQIPEVEVNAVVGQEGGYVDVFRLFLGVFGGTSQAVVGLDAAAFSEWDGVRNQLMHGREISDDTRLEQGCVFVCDAIRHLSGWGLTQPIAYDGLVPLGSVGLPTVKTSDGSLSERLVEVAGGSPAFPQQRWQELRASLGATAPTTPGTV